MIEMISSIESYRENSDFYLIKFDLSLLKIV